jgi:hypothetical protein
MEPFKKREEDRERAHRDGEIREREHRASSAFERQNQSIRNLKRQLEMHKEQEAIGSEALERGDGYYVQISFRSVDYFPH